MTTDSNHMYVGIDLGTTLSSIAWGFYDPSTGHIQAKDFDFDQMVGDGRRERRVLLPSYIYFKQGEDFPYVGDYARMQGLQFQPSRVVKAVKNHMGKRDWRFPVDGKEYTPAELSAILLKTLYAGMKSTWGFPVQDVVICVPASFDNDMRRDTVEAARMAGFKTFEKDGAERNLLLDEPRAALFDLVNRQKTNSLPRTVIDFSSPKYVLVFDLGGGTLDVSIHKVAQAGENSAEIDVQDLAISRYTQLGGGLFDALIADELQRRFEEKARLCLDDLADIDRQMVRFKLEDQAERVKINMTNIIQRRIDNGDDNIPQDLAGIIQLPFLYDQYALMTSITKQAMDDLIAPLLGWEYSLKDVDRFGDIDYSKANNIIYPILDVLAKAKERNNGQMPTVDAVVLNGGMTRMYQVKKRLEAFFGIRPIEILDPDKSVSRGAAVYHYMIHQGYKPRSILAESVGVLVKGNKIYHLAKAGTVLPYQKTFEDLLATPDDVSTIIRMPLYRGEMKTPTPPNQKLAEAKFVLNAPLPVDTPITVDLEITDNKLVHFVARVAGAQTSIRVAETGEVVEETKGMPQVAEPEQAAARGFKKLARSQMHNKPMGEEVVIQNVRNVFKSAADQTAIPNLRKTSRAIFNACNIDEAMLLLINELTTFNRVGREEALRLIGEFVRLYPDDPLRPAITQVCLRHLELEVLNNPKAIASYGRAASVALGKIGDEIAESQLINIISNRHYLAARQDAIFALGKCGHTLNAITHVSKYVSSDTDGERLAAAWAIGHIGSRENEHPVEVADLEDLITVIGAQAAKETHDTARKFEIYAFGELCDQRGGSDVPKVSKEMAGYAKELLKKIRADISPQGRGENEEIRQTRLFLEIVQSMVSGVVLSDEQSISLAAIRGLPAVNYG